MSYKEQIKKMNVDGLLTEIVQALHKRCPQVFIAVISPKTGDYYDCSTLANDEVIAGVQTSLFHEGIVDNLPKCLDKAHQLLLDALGLPLTRVKIDKVD